MQTDVDEADRITTATDDNPSQERGRDVDVDSADAQDGGAEIADVVVEPEPSGYGNFALGTAV